MGGSAERSLFNSKELQRLLAYQGFVEGYPDHGEGFPSRNKAPLLLLLLLLMGGIR